MARQLSGKVIVATHNPGKLREMAELLAPYGIETVSAGELGLAPPAETGHMFAENAAIKAHAAAHGGGLPALADDSGICIDALDGAPGLFSADWAEGKDFGPPWRGWNASCGRRNALAPGERRAHFVSALVIAWPDGHDELFEGRVFGTVVSPRGAQGFGYDPLFQPDGSSRTFGEMSAAEKHGIDWERREALSHRARAFLALAEACLPALPT
jgi:XTP/dITP diphosphohydrolase